ncbi:MAG: trimethylamine methyltransferase family protein [Thermoanaerobaculales bacterium]|nr:trimethylamine methyltransferase family protein [Thermoanaerobaculales bacterium]
MQRLRPKISVMTSRQIGRVHDRSLHILATVGLEIDSEKAVEIFKGAGAEVDGSRVRIPADLVQWALDVAPSSVDIYDRRGNPAFRIGDGSETRFGIGVTALQYQDPMTDEISPFQRSHMKKMVRLGQTLPSFDVISTVGIIQDIGPETADLYAALEMVANGTKPLVVLVSQEDLFPAVLDLLEHLHGDLASKPFVIPYFNPVTPLIINRGTIDKMRATIDRGLPFMYSNYGMAGATTPITPAGILALLNAELLAGLVLSQLLKEGTPVILGMLPAYFDMRGMANFYDPISYVLNLACAEMMTAYRMPHCGTGGSGMGWGADLIAAGNQWANHLTSCLGKIGLAPFIGDNLGAVGFSPALAVYADEVIAQARRFAHGFEIDDASFALDDVSQVGPGGNFLMAESTLERFRTAYFESAIFPNLTVEDWRQQGKPRADDRLRSHTQHLLEGLEAPDDHDDLVSRGEAFIRSVAE